MTGTLHAWCMGMGALAALIPVGHVLTAGGRVSVGSGVVVGHCGMATCMAVLAVGNGHGPAELVALGLAVVTALLAVELGGQQPGIVHSVIDLLATAWIVLRGCATPAVGSMTAAAGHHHMAASGHTSALLNWLPLTVWIGAILIAGRHTARCGGPRGGRTMTVASLLMALSMAPMIA